jgi:hypothetical protein
MNESESNFQAASESSNENLRADVQSLRTMLSVTLLLLFIFTFCVNVFFLRQVSAVNAQVAQAQQLVDNFQKGGGYAQGAELVSRLNEYSRTHPDFAPIMQKYNFSITRNGAPTPAKK